MPKGTYKRSEETRRKLSIFNKGKKLSDSHKLNIKNTMMNHECSPETRRKISESNKQRIKEGKHNWWKGGITPETRRIRMSMEYKLWRKSVFERDKYTCVWCGVRSGNGKTVILQADHIKPFTHYPELRFAIDNGRTLCVDCHKTTDTYGTKIKNYKII